MTLSLAFFKPWRQHAATCHAHSLQTPPAALPNCLCRTALCHAAGGDDMTCPPFSSHLFSPSSHIYHSICHLFMASLLFCHLKHFLSPAHLAFLLLWLYSILRHGYCHTRLSMHSLWLCLPSRHHSCLPCLMYLFKQHHQPHNSTEAAWPSEDGRTSCALVLHSPPSPLPAASHLIILLLLWDGGRAKSGARVCPLRLRTLAADVS